jgi:magnesium chelatase family protein
VPVARTHSIALVGVEGHAVEIESDIENGLPGLLLIGLPDTALREARDRIRAAIINSGEQWPQRRITVGLSPASLPKRGSGFDVGIAVSILAAAGTVPVTAIEGVTFLGELGLDGRLRPVCGVLPAVAAAAAAGFRKVAVPEASAPEATLVPELTVVGAPSLSVLLAWLRGEPETGQVVTVVRSGEGAGVQLVQAGRRVAAALPEAADQPRPSGQVRSGPDPGGHPDLADVLGQPAARRAAEICAAGGHHLSLLGPPGAGKPMLKF